MVEPPPTDAGEARSDITRWGASSRPSDAGHVLGRLANAQRRRPDFSVAEF